MQDFYAFLEANRQRFVDELRTLCRIPSISTDPTHVADMQAAAEYLSDRLRGLGARVRMLRIEDSHPYVLAELGEGERTLLIYDHYDVQPALREDGWQHDPFDPHIHEGVMYARGVADNKGNLLFRLQALEAWQAVFGDFPLRVRFFIEGEEEIGSPHLPAFSRTYADDLRADGCIWESGRRSKEGIPIIELGLRGILYVELRLRAPNRAMHSSWANVVENPVFDLQNRLRHALQSLTDSQGRPLFLQGIVPDPAPDDLALLPHIPFDPQVAASEYNIRLRPGLDGVEMLRRLFFEPSCNVCGIGVGYTGPGVKTVIPNTATAKLDMRLPPGITPQVALVRMQQYLRARGYDDIEIHPLVGMRAARTDPNAAVVQAARQAVEAVYGRAPIVYPLMPASGPMYDLCQALGTPALCLGATHPGSGAHSVDENIYLEDYFRMMQVFGVFLQRFAAAPL